MNIKIGDVLDNSLGASHNRYKVVNQFGDLFEIRVTYDRGATTSNKTAWLIDANGKAVVGFSKDVGRFTHSTFSVVEPKKIEIIRFYNDNSTDRDWYPLEVKEPYQHYRTARYAVREERNNATIRLLTRDEFQKEFLQR